MKFFNKQLKANTTGTISGRMALYLEQMQRKLAEWLNRRAADLSRQHMLFGLIIFCTAFGGYLLWLIADTLGIFN